jgi:DNA modification methylase
MESCTIQLTRADIANNKLNIRPCGKGFFPNDIFGSSKRKNPGNPITLKVYGLPNPVQTDIPKDTAGKPRWLFRERAWVKKFVHVNKLKPGDIITISRINERIYQVIPGNGVSTMTSILTEKHTHTVVPLHKPRETKHLDIAYTRTCNCPKTHINCLAPKEWLKCQLGVWQFTYSGRDIRDKEIHPATFPISLARKVIELFTHKGELVLDPFVGSGTTLVASQDLGRNSVGFDLQKKYINLAESRLKENTQLFSDAKQIAICEDALNISHYLPHESVSLIFTSPPYANLLNRKRKNKSRRNRNNDQLGKIEQYSQDQRDLGTMSLEEYTVKMGDIFERLFPLMRPKAHCVINVPDMWWDNHRITIHVSLIEELRRRGYELRNIIIWDRTNIVNQIGIFGWPSNYITMGVTFEYLLDFWRPPKMKS